MPTLKVRFSTTEDETLIHCVSTYPVLYDAADATHRDHELKDNVWGQVATTVKRTGKVLFNYIYLHQQSTRGC